MSLWYTLNQGSPLEVLPAAAAYCDVPREVLWHFVLRRNQYRLCANSSRPYLMTPSTSSCNQTVAKVSLESSRAILRLELHQVSLQHRSDHIRPWISPSSSRILEMSIVKGRLRMKRIRRQNHH